MKLLGWSGGPDSTYELVRLLRENEDVMAFTVASSFDPSYHYQAVMASRTRRLHRYLSHKICPFPWVFYRIDRTGDPGGESAADHKETEHDAIARMLLWLHRNNNPCVVWCYCAEDDLGPVPDLADEFIPTLHVNRDVSKSDMRAYLGEEIWAMTTSCDRPNEYGGPCGLCLKCKQRDAA